MKRNEFKYIECADCEDGQVYTDTSRQCTKYRGDCCGGCGYSYPCEECEGTGEIEVEVESQHSTSNKTRNRNFNTLAHQHHFARIVNQWQNWERYRHKFL